MYQIQGVFRKRFFVYDEQYYQLTHTFFSHLIELPLIMVLKTNLTLDSVMCILCLS